MTLLSAEGLTTGTTNAICTNNGLCGASSIATLLSPVFCYLIIIYYLLSSVGLLLSMAPAMATAIMWAGQIPTVELQGAILIGGVETKLR
jgi:arginine exporter protein ArgO